MVGEGTKGGKCCQCGNVANANGQWGREGCQMGGGRGEYGVWEGGRGKSAAVFAFLGAESVANSWLSCLLGVFVPGERAETSWFFANPRRRCLEEPRKFFSGKTLRVRAPPRRASRFPVCHGLPRASQGTGNRGRALFVAQCPSGSVCRYNPMKSFPIGHFRGVPFKAGRGRGFRS